MNMIFYVCGTFVFVSLKVGERRLKVKYFSMCAQKRERERERNLWLPPQGVRIKKLFRSKGGRKEGRKESREKIKIKKQDLADKVPDPYKG